jgi:DNA repair photolyase
MLGELYYPTGKALETAQQVLQVNHPIAVNVAWGCTNMCDYCYIPYIKKGCVRFPKQPVCKLVEKQLNNNIKPGTVVFIHWIENAKNMER